MLETSTGRLVVGSILRVIYMLENKLMIIDGESMVRAKSADLEYIRR